MRVDDPYIIIDAWDWGGFSIEKTDSGTLKSGLMGVNVRIKEKGKLEVETSWGIETFSGGDKLIALDVATIVSHLKKMGKEKVNDDSKARICCDLISTVLTHELSHWAEEHYRPGRAHGFVWDRFYFEFVYPYINVSGGRVV